MGLYIPETEVTLMTNRHSIGVLIPGYHPDLPVLKEYLTDIARIIEPDAIRLELDDPVPETTSYLKDISVDVQVNTSQHRRGKGCAIMEGFDALDTDILAFADADGSTPAEDLKRIISQVEIGDADVSIGSRRHPDSSIVKHQTVLRRRLGDVFAFIAKRMLPTRCRDYQCGAKAVRATAWGDIGHHCYEPGFAWDLEFVSVAGSLGYDITEVPITWKDHSDSKVNLVSTPIELATAIVDVKRRTDAIANSPRYRNTQKTYESTLVETEGMNDE